MFLVEMLAVVAAMPEELAPLVARARETRVLSDRSPFKLQAARLVDRSVALVVTGDGARNARLGVEALGAAVAVDGLVVVGVAGAATSDLRPGALVVADEVQAEAGASFLADPAIVERAVRRAGARAAHVVSATAIADSPERKRDLAARAGAAGAPVAVDLESATYVAAAARMGVPWTVLRVISDAADEALPALLNQARDDGGAVKRGAVALRLLGSPGALPVLLRLRARVRDAGEQLADAVERVLLAS
jgi:nucleoside phosphorylase